MSDDQLIMADKIHFYHNPVSRARIAHWMIEESGAPYEIHLIDFKKNEQKSPEFLKINPMGKLPAIVHREIVVTEVAAICCYLADAFPNAQLAPALDDPARGTYFRWLFFAASCVEPAVMDRVFQRPEAKASAIGYGTYPDMIHALESALKPGPYVLGDKFSAADLYLCSQIAYSTMIKGMDPNPTFDAYVERCQSRPAFKRVIEFTDAQIAKAKE